MPAAATQSAAAIATPSSQAVARDMDMEERWGEAAALPCTVSIEVPVRGFTLRDLLALGQASIIGSRHPASANLPLQINGELISWCEFEVLGNRLAVRLTELA